MADEKKPALAPWWKRALAVVGTAAAVVGLAWLAVKRDQADAAADLDPDPEYDPETGNRIVDTSAEVKE